MGTATSWRRRPWTLRTAPCVRITVDDADWAAKVFELLMGSQVAPRKESLVQGAYEIDVEALDAWGPADGDPFRLASVLRRGSPPLGWSHSLFPAHTRPGAGPERRARPFAVGSGITPWPGSELLLDQAGVDVVQEAADRDRVGDQRVCADLPTSSCSAAFWSAITWNGCHEASGRPTSRPGPAVRPRRCEAIAHRVCGTTRIRSTSSRCTPSTSASSAGGDAAAGVAEDLRVTRSSRASERIDARVHAGHDRDAGVGDAVEPGEVEILRELLLAASRSSKSATGRT